MKKPGTILFALALAASLLWGCSANIPEQTVTCEELTLTLPGSFQNKSDEAYASDLDLLYSSEEAAVMVTSESSESLTAFFPEMDTLLYAQLFLRSNGLPETISTMDGIPTFTYTRDSAGTSLTYLCGVYQSQTHFYVVQIYCGTNRFPELESQLREILASVRT